MNMLISHMSETCWFTLYDSGQPAKGRSSRLSHCCNKPHLCTEVDHHTDFLVFTSHCTVTAAHNMWNHHEKLWTPGIHTSNSSSVGPIHPFIVPWHKAVDFNLRNRSGRHQSPHVSLSAQLACLSFRHISDTNTHLFTYLMAQSWSWHSNQSNDDQFIPVHLLDAKKVW